MMARVSLMDRGSWLNTFLQHNMDRLLEVTVWDKESLTKNDFLGRMAIKLSHILPPVEEGLEGWFQLFDGERGKGEFLQLEATGEAADHFVAIQEHLPRGPEELLLRKEDLVNKLREDNDWWLVENAYTGSQGFVPCTFLAPSWSLNSEPWFFGSITRAKAETLLLNPMRKHGCYLIRESESSPGQYSLSMRDGDSVRHFRVQSLPENKYRLHGSPSPAFCNLAELVAFHKKKKAGLTTTLKDPCPKPQAATTSDLSYGDRDKWEIPRDQIELVGVLGQGQYGEVYRGLWKDTIEVAVKTLKEDTSCSEDFLAEAAIMKKMQHPNLIQLYAVCTVGTPIYIITELMAKGCLLDFLQSPSGEALRLPALIDMGSNVAAGMEYLERNNFIHRDLAARNILVGEGLVCKVADFGFARLIKDEEYTSENLQKFPVRWTAPEAMACNTYSIKSDVWSFGILLTELVSYGRKPYQGLTNKQVVEKLDAGFRMPQMPGCPDGLYKMMLECWKTESQDRPTFESLRFRLEDFFSSGEANYTEASKLLDDD